MKEIPRMMMMMMMIMITIIIIIILIIIIIIIMFSLSHFLLSIDCEKFCNSLLLILR